MIRKALFVWFGLTALAAVLLVFLCVAEAEAQFTISLSDKTVIGTVSRVDGNKVLLFDDRIAVDVSNARIRGGFGPTPIASLTPGTRIAAGFTHTANDGSLVAATLEILPEQDATIEAKIERIDWAARTLQVAGQTIRLTDTTTARRINDGALVPVSELLPLMHVVLSLDRDEPGLAADNISFSANPNTVTTGGTLHAIDGNNWTIGGGGRGVVVRVTEDTFIGGEPRLGERVLVTYRGDAAGDLVALYILRLSYVDESDVAGEVKAISGQTITIDRGTRSTTLRIDASTKFRGTIDVGDVVVARADGNRAQSVEEVFAVDFTFGFSGDVTSIQGNEWTVAGVTFSVTPNTLVTGSPQVGDRANVLAFSVNDRWYAMTLDKL